MLDTQYLNELIKASGKTKTYLAKKLGLSYQGFLNKITGKRDFTEHEATILCDELNVTSMAERRKIFCL